MLRALAPTKHRFHGDGLISRWFLPWALRFVAKCVHKHFVEPTGRWAPEKSKINFFVMQTLTHAKGVFACARLILTGSFFEKHICFNYICLSDLNRFMSSIGRLAFASYEILFVFLGSRQPRSKGSKRANNAYRNRNSSINIILLKMHPQVKKRQCLWLTSDLPMQRIW